MLLTIGQSECKRTKVFIFAPSIFVFLSQTDSYQHSLDLSKVFVMPNSERSPYLMPYYGSLPFVLLFEKAEKD